LKEGEDKEKRKDERSVFVCVGERLFQVEETTVFKELEVGMSSVQFSHSIVSNSL